MILASCVVHPKDFDYNSIPAGMVSSISDEILDFSGFQTPKKAKSILDAKREKAGSVRGLMKAFVLATIATDSPEFLETLSFSQLAERVALAEQIIRVKQAINGMEPTEVTLALIDPEEEVKKAEDFKERYNKSRKDGEARIDDPIAQKLWGS